MKKSIHDELARELTPEEIDAVSGGDVQSPITLGRPTYDDPPGAPDDQDSSISGDEPKRDFGVDFQWPF